MRIQLSDHFNSRRLFRFALPSILMMVFTSFYSVVDGIFVSNYGGADALAGVNLVYPLIMILSSFGFVIGTGGSAIVGKTLGEQDPEKANRIFSMLVYVEILFGILLAVFGFIFLKPIILRLGATEALLPYSIPYARILMMAVPFNIVQFSAEMFFVTAEKPKLSLYSSLVCGITNIFLDWFLVGYLKLGVEGAGMATAFCQVLGGVFPVIYFSRKNDSLLKLGRPELSFRPLLKSLTNGFSEFLNFVSMNIVAILFNLQLLKYIGEIGVTVYGIIMYVDFLFVAVYIGYSNGVAPIISYNFGAKNDAELRNVFVKSLRVLAAFAVSMLIFSQTMARPLCWIFAGYDKELLDLSVHAFRIYALSFPICALPIFSSSFFTALNDGLTSALISFLRTGVFEIAAVLTFPLLFGIDGIWYSVVATGIVACLLAAGFLWAKRRNFGFGKKKEDIA